MVEGRDEGAGEEDDGTFSEVETVHVKFEESFLVFFAQSSVLKKYRVDRK